MIKTVRTLCIIDVTFLVSNPLAKAKLLECTSFITRKTTAQCQIEQMGDGSLLTISSDSDVLPVRKEVEHLMPLLDKAHRDLEKRNAEGDMRLERRYRVRPWTPRVLPKPRWTPESETDLLHEQAVIARAAATAKAVKFVKKGRVSDATTSLPA